LLFSAQIRFISHGLSQSVHLVSRTNYTVEPAVCQIHSRRCHGNRQDSGKPWPHGAPCRDGPLADGRATAPRRSENRDL